jgi:hypothetical protein
MQWLIIGAVVWFLTQRRPTTETSETVSTETTPTTTSKKTPPPVDLPHTGTTAPHDLALQKPPSGLDPVSGKYVFG